MTGLIVDTSGLARGAGLIWTDTLSGGPGLAASDGAALSISGTPDPAATVGAPYLFEPATAGGSPPYAFSMGAVALPAGLALDPATGAISGDPAEEGATAALVLIVTDAMSRSDELPPFSITVSA